jgi:mRNA interferase MazF
MVMNRGEIYLCDFGDPIGSGPGYIRPVVIVQDDKFNNSGIATTVTLSVTSNPKYKAHPGCLLLLKSETGLDRDSVVNATLITAVDKSQLTHRIGTVPDELMVKIEDCMKLVLGME